MRTIYDAELSLEQIEFTDRCNSDGRKRVTGVLYYDPFFTKVLKTWYRFLGIEKAKTLEISDPDFIARKLKENKKELDNNEDYRILVCASNLPDIINDAITRVCAAYELYTENKSNKVTEEK